MSKIMSKITAFIEWFKMSYPTRNETTLRRRASTLTVRLNAYAESNYGSDSADRMAAVVETSWSILNGC